MCIKHGCMTILNIMIKINSLKSSPFIIQKFLEQLSLFFVIILLLSQCFGFCFTHPSTGIHFVGLSHCVSGFLMSAWWNCQKSSIKAKGTYPLVLLSSPMGEDMSHFQFAYNTVISLHSLLFKKPYVITIIFLLKPII